MYPMQMNQAHKCGQGLGGVFGFNTRAAHAAEMGSVGAISNARGLAGMYAPLANGGSLKGVSLVNRDTLVRMGAVSSASSLDREDFEWYPRGSSKGAHRLTSTYL